MFKYVQVTGCCSLPRTIFVSGLRSTVMDWFFCFTEFPTTRMPCSQLRHEPCSGPKPKAWTGRVGVLLCDERCETGPNTEIDRIHMNTPKGSIEWANEIGLAHVRTTWYLARICRDSSIRTKNNPAKKLKSRWHRQKSEIRGGVGRSRKLM